MKYNNFENFSHWYNNHQYHFAHWCAFNMLAMNLGVWKLHHFFHDWYKPWINDLLIPTSGEVLINGEKPGINSKNVIYIEKYSKKY